MSARLNRSERGVWIAAVTVLGTSLATLAALDLACLAHAWVSGTPAACAVARAMARVARSALDLCPLSTLPLLAIGAFAALAAVGVLVALREGAGGERGVDHV